MLTRCFTENGFCKLSITYQQKWGFTCICQPAIVGQTPFSQPQYQAKAKLNFIYLFIY